MKCLKCGKKFTYKEMLIASFKSWNDDFTCDKCYTEYHVKGSTKFFWILIVWGFMFISNVVLRETTFTQSMFITILIAVVIALLYPIFVNYDVKKWGHL